MAISHVAIICESVARICQVMAIESTVFLPAACGMVLRRVESWGRGLGLFGPALFLCMANLTTLSEIVRFSIFFRFKNFSIYFTFQNFRFSEISYLLKFPDFQKFYFRSLSEVFQSRRRLLRPLAVVCSDGVQRRLRSCPRPQFYVITFAFLG